MSTHHARNIMLAYYIPYIAGHVIHHSWISAASHRCLAGVAYPNLGVKPSRLLLYQTLAHNVVITSLSCMHVLLLLLLVTCCWC
jgi:hypothetical protein